MKVSWSDLGRNHQAWQRKEKDEWAWKKEDKLRDVGKWEGLDTNGKQKCTSANKWMPKLESLQPQLTTFAWTQWKKWDFMCYVHCSCLPYIYI